jgi:hypothetical protein
MAFTGGLRRCNPTPIWTSSHLPEFPKVFPSGMKTAPGQVSGAVSFSSGDGIRTCDLWL